MIEVTKLPTHMSPILVSGLLLTVVFTIVDANEYGICSFYAEDYQGKPTASGELFDMNKMTAAHKSLPFNSVIRVKNHKNGKSITIRVNDRGPFVSGRIIDLSKAAFAMVEPTDSGLFPCSYSMEKGGDETSESYCFHIEHCCNLTFHFLAFRSSSPAKPEYRSPTCFRAGTFRHPETCERFYRCIRDPASGQLKRYEYRCPSPTVFDSVYQVCNWPQNVPSCTGFDNRIR